MEWLNNKGLKQSFLIINMLFLCAGLLLSMLSFSLCINLRSSIESYPKYEITLNENDKTIIFDHADINTGYENSGMHNAQIIMLDVLQFVLPVFFVVLSLVLADMAFYNIKLKKPLAVLQNGAVRIQQQDLDFSVEKFADDELGSLCIAFDTMRKELLSNNMELWHQMEERKRLNAAFSHDLRNPVTVLKGSAKILQKCVERQTLTDVDAKATIDLIAQYAERIETYVDAMTRAQKLEELTCVKQIVDWHVLCSVLKNSLSFLGQMLIITFRGEGGKIWADQSLIQNVTENLVSNALRYAETNVSVDIVNDNGQLIITVSDDGPGFPQNILKKGAAPFLRSGDTVEVEHFGMGLYVCRLLCEKHGGSLVLANTEMGAKATAFFEVLKS